MRRAWQTVLATLLALSAMGGAVWAETEIEVFNGGFELLPPGVSAEQALGKVPYGWAATSPGGSWQVGLSQEKVLSGTYSVNITVDASQGGILVSSKPIPVEPGKTYAALWNVYNVHQPPTYQEGIHLYLEFWPEGGWWGDEDYWSAASWEQSRPAPWSTRSRVGVFWEGKAQTFDQWFQVVVAGQAPQDAKYATLSLWTANRTMKVYVDDVRFAVLD